MKRLAILFVIALAACSSDTDTVVEPLPVDECSDCFGCFKGVSIEAASDTTVSVATRVCDADSVFYGIAGDCFVPADSTVKAEAVDPMNPALYVGIVDSEFIAITVMAYRAGAIRSFVCVLQ